MARVDNDGPSSDTPCRDLQKLKLILFNKRVGAKQHDSSVDVLWYEIGQRDCDALGLAFVLRKKLGVAALAARVNNPNYTRHLDGGSTRVRHFGAGETYNPPKTWDGVERARLQMLRQKQSRRRPWSP